MQPVFTCVRRWPVVALLAVFALATQRASAADDASIGYETIRPSLVKVWTFDPSGRPLQSGTGIVVDSNDRRSLVLTASHVVAGAASVRIDVSRDLHDLAAHIDRTGPRDLTLLAVERGGLHAARFAPRTHPVVEGNLVAVAGYVKNDELIGVVGQEPRVLFPGTVSSRPDNGLYLELENVHIEEGLSGGAVFDPGTGQILGIVTSRTSDRRGGFADSGTLVVVPFLETNHIAAVDPPAAPRTLATPRTVALAAAPPPRPLPVATLRALPEPAPAVLPLPAMVLRPAPIATLQAVIAISAPHDFAGGVVSWQAGMATPKRFVYTQDGCRVAVTIDVQTLQFVVAHQALVQPHRRGSLLAITLSQRAGANDACADVADAEPADGAYEPTAMSFDGHHVTMRFVYAGDPDNSDRFPTDASLDADLEGDTVSATVQFFAANWTGSIELPLARTALASVSSSW
jgi:hypothetical protein